MIDEKKLASDAKCIIDRYICLGVINKRRVGWCYLSNELLKDIIEFKHWNLVWENKNILWTQPNLLTEDTVQYVFYDESLDELSEDEEIPKYTFRIGKGIITKEHSYIDYSKQFETFYTCEWKRGEWKIEQH